MASQFMMFPINLPISWLVIKCQTQLQKLGMPIQDRFLGLQYTWVQASLKGIAMSDLQGSAFTKGAPAILLNLLKKSHCKTGACQGLRSFSLKIPVDVSHFLDFQHSLLAYLRLLELHENIVSLCKVLVTSLLFKGVLHFQVNLCPSKYP